MDGEAIRHALRNVDADRVVLALPGVEAPDYGVVSQMAQAVADGVAGKPAYVCLQADMAKALGHALALRLPQNAPCLCIDRVALTAGDYLDVGQPVGPALPVVVKTLVLAEH